MTIASKLLSLFTTATLAATLAACAGGDPPLGTDEAELAQQEVTYIYYDCANPEVGIGWRFHGCVSGNAWSSDGIRSQCFEVESDDCSNESHVIQYCEQGLCASFSDQPPLPYSEWAAGN